MLPPFTIQQVITRYAWLWRLDRERGHEGLEQAELPLTWSLVVCPLVYQLAGEDVLARRVRLPHSRLLVRSFPNHISLHKHPVFWAPRLISFSRSPFAFWTRVGRAIQTFIGAHLPHPRLTRPGFSSLLGVSAPSSALPTTGPNVT